MNKIETINPYNRPNSAIFAAFELAKAGTTRAKLVQFCEKQDIGVGRVLRELKLEDFRNMTWSYSEKEDGSIKISNVKAKAAKAKVAKVKAAPAEPKPAAKASKKKPTAKPAEAKQETK